MLPVKRASPKWPPQRHMDEKFYKTVLPLSSSYTLHIHICPAISICKVKAAITVKYHASPCCRCLKFVATRFSSGQIQDSSGIMYQLDVYFPETGGIMALIPPIVSSTHKKIYLGKPAAFVLLLYQLF
jgi:hypothetical protein